MVIPFIPHFLSLRLFAAAKIHLPRQMEAYTHYHCDSPPLSLRGAQRRSNLFFVILSKAKNLLLHYHFTMLDSSPAAQNDVQPCHCEECSDEAISSLSF